MNAPHVVIVGGGITGLSAAYHLEQMAADAELAITLVESDARVGGRVDTEYTEGYLLDTGPDSFMGQKPWAVQLCRELGMEDEVIRPLARKFYMLHDGKLHSVPHELVTLVPSKPEALWKASFLSMQAKTRASMEGLVPAQHEREDESLSAFMRRRFGEEFALRFAEPMMGGVHAGHPDRMSMRSIYPMYWEMEQSKGSITRALMERRAAAALKGGQPSVSPFVALRHGMISLVERVRASLTRTDVRIGTRVAAVEPGVAGGVRVSFEDGSTIDASAVVLAVPAYDAADLLRPAAAEAADLLVGIRYASTAVVSLAYRQDEVGDPLDGSGYLVPRDEPCAITGCTWTHRKWEGRAPEGMALMRAFMGYDGADRAVEEQSEERLAFAAHESLAKLLSIKGVPAFQRVYRCVKVMPQYAVGHRARLDAIAGCLEAMPGVILAGAAYRGVGVPDCVRQGKEAAEAVLARVAAEPRVDADRGGA